jgi:competence protein ComEC
MAAFGTGPLVLATAGIVLLGLLRTPLRWLGAGALVAATLWAVVVPQPDILVSGDGHSVAVRDREGRLRVMRAAKDAFLVREWLAADADGRAATDPALSEGVSCDPDGCVVEMADGRLVALASQPQALSDDCTRAAVIVTSRQAPAGCGTLVIDQERLRRQGTLAVHRKGDGFEVTAIRPDGVDRPWSPAVAETPKPRAPTRAKQPVVDATPAVADQLPED